MTSVLAPVVCPVLPDVGPEPASFIFAARPVVSHGPACAVPAFRIIMAQAARMSRFVFICFCLVFVPGCVFDVPGRTRNGPVRRGFRVER